MFSAGFHDDHGTYLEHEDVRRANEAVQSSDEEPDIGPSESEDKLEDEKEGHALEEAESQDHASIAQEANNDRAGENSNLEKAPNLERQQTSKSVRSQRQRDPNLVTWNGPDDPENPKNWAMKRKWIATFVVSSFTFISPVASAMVAPALPQMAQDLNVSNTIESQMMLSIFILAYAFGPLVLGPLSELYGRVPVLQLANLVFLVFNLVCGFAQNGAQMIVFRFISGLGGSAPLAIGGGILVRIEGWKASRCPDKHLNLRHLLTFPSLGGLLQCRTERKSNRHLLSRSSHWPCGWSSCWWVHIREHQLAVGLLDCINCRRCCPDIWCVFPAGDMGPKTSAAKGQKPQKRNWQ